jgi:YgiT-type zinc finger domain-containing protein
MMSEQRCRGSQGELELRRVSRAQEYEERRVVIENLPALVCRQCGERFFTPDVPDRVVSLAQGRIDPTRTAIIEIYDAARIT